MIGPIQKKSLRVLTVDNDDRFRASMNYRLRKEYCAAVNSVASGMEAIDLIKTGEVFDLVLVDFMMPDMDGIETSKELRKINPNCYVVIMSAYSDTDAMEQAKELGLQLLPKPIPEDMLAQVMLEAVTQPTQG